MSSICEQYSGVVLNQNAPPTGDYAWRSGGGGMVYQTFTLPLGYQRGTNANEQSIPDLSGCQIYVNIDEGFAESASIDYVLQYYSDGWITLSHGTVIGCHTDGDCWFDIIFPSPVPISVPMLGNQFRIGMATRSLHGLELNVPVEVSAGGEYLVRELGFTANLVDGVPYPIVVGTIPAYLMSRAGEVTYSIQQGVNTIKYVSPTPLINYASGQGQAYQTDEVTPLLGSGTASLDFRLLGLIGDSGTDFLGNEYRSIVSQSGAGNTDTTKGLLPVQGSTSGEYWMSPPYPSKFAVAPRYFDVRPLPSAISYGNVNLIGDPGFEYDYPTSAPLWWAPVTSGATVVDQTVVQGWAASGLNSLHMKYTFPSGTNTNGIKSPLLNVAPITAGSPTPLSVSLAYDIVTSPGTVTLGVSFFFYDANSVLLSSSSNGTAGITGQGTMSASTVMPTTATQVVIQIAATSTASGSFEAYVDDIQFTLTPASLGYFDGDLLGYMWSGQRGASSSVQIIEPTIQDSSVVIDGVLVDALTPNMAFNVYYSTDDAGTSPEMTEADWENKLWTRVPQVYICDQRQQYAFPEPIQAKYMKLEFTNLQASTYDPGPFQQPISYKKFPTWVANFFIADMEAPSFIVDQVNVQYDALDFAYSYYLDDLHQSPDYPATAPQSASSQLTSYFSNATPADAVDATTLSKINFVMNIFAQTPNNNVDTSSAVGAFVDNLHSGPHAPNTTFENSTLLPIDYSTVSTMLRDPVVFEQSLPVMFFFLTCRHSYKELSAPFDHNRAYFAGVNGISFIRHNYTTAADNGLYIESGGDTQNVELNDFIIDSDNNWFSYE